MPQTREKNIKWEVQRGRRVIEHSENIAETEVGGGESSGKIGGALSPSKDVWMVTRWFLGRWIDEWSNSGCEGLCFGEYIDWLISSSRTAGFHFIYSVTVFFLVRT
jgi:hypothetical protein